MRTLIPILILISISFAAYGATENDTTFILRKAGEYPEHPEKIRHAEISLYVYSGEGPEFINDYLRIIEKLSEWPNLSSLLITHVDRPDMVVAFKKSMAKFSKKNSLKALDIRASFGLVPLPEEIFQVRSLEVLAIWDMRIKELPASLGNLTNLREFYILGNEDFTIPAELSKLKKLYKIYFHGIDFEDANCSLKKFASLGSVRDLTMIGCDYKESPKIAKLFPQLVSLQSDGLCDQIEEILTLKNLKYLSLSCMVNDSLKAEIDKKLPGCTVILNQEFCFPGSAEVITSNGRVKISSIIPGTQIITIDPETGIEDTATVIGVDRHALKAYTVLNISVGIHMPLASHEFLLPVLTLQVTPNHPLFLENGTIVRADEIRIGDHLLALDEYGIIQPVTVTRIEMRTMETELYNLVTSKGSYLVEGVLVSDKF